MASSNKKLSQCIDPGVDYLPAGESAVATPEPSIAAPAISATAIPATIRLRFI